MMPPGGSLYARVVTRLVLVLLVTGTTLVLAAWFYAKLAADEAFDQVLVAGALQIAENTWLRNDVLNVDVPVSAFYVMSRRDRVFYKVIDPSGKVIAGDPELPLSLQMDSLQQGPVFQTASYQGETIRIALIARQMYDPGPKGWAIVALAETEDARRELARNMVTKLLVVVFVMGAITIVGAMLAVRQALLPMERLSRAIKQRDPGSLEPLDLVAPVEAEPLVATINAFIGRLNDRIVLMRRVIGDVAHQVRTPITAALGQVELLEYESTDEGRHRQIEKMRKRLSEVGLLVQQLISHAMVLHRADGSCRQPVDLCLLVRNELTELASGPAAREIDVSFDGPGEPVLILGDAVTLREAVRNVFDNALSHGARTRLNVCVEGMEGCAKVVVRDDGPGISPDRWEAVKAPFTPRSDGRSGASLGLAIVARYAELYDEIVGR